MHKNAAPFQDWRFAQRGLVGKNQTHGSDEDINNKKNWLDVHFGYFLSFFSDIIISYSF